MVLNKKTGGSSMVDDFNPAKLRLDLDNIPSGPPPSKKQSSSKAPFIKLPLIWEETLAGARASGSTYRVALLLLYMAWKSDTYVVKLTNVALAKKGVGRKGKAAALLVLRKVGLVTVEERPRKSPIVTLRLVQ
jgi:hypothetical protein